MSFVFFTFGQNTCGRDMRMSFWAASLGARFLGAADVFAESLRADVGGQGFEDAGQLGRGQGSEVPRPLSRRYGNHHSVVSRCQLSRQVVAGEAFPFRFRPMGRGQSTLHHADHVVRQQGHAETQQCRPRITSWDSELRRLRFRIPLALLLGPPGYLKHESDWAVERRRHGAVFLHFLLQPQ